MLSKDVTVFVKNEHSDDVKMDKVFSCKWCNFIKKNKKKQTHSLKLQQPNFTKRFMAYKNLELGIDLVST